MSQALNWQRARARLAEQAELQREARLLLRKLGLMPMLRAVGRASVVGSVPAGVILKPDLDIHVLVKPDCEVEACLDVARQLMASGGTWSEVMGLGDRNHWGSGYLRHHGIKTLELVRFAARKAALLYFLVPCRHEDWRVDIWFTSNPADIAVRHTRWLRRSLTDRHRLRILALKDRYDHWGQLRWGLSTLIYEAVLTHDARNVRDFVRFLKDAVRAGRLPDPTVAEEVLRTEAVLGRRKQDSGK